MKDNPGCRKPSRGWGVGRQDTLTLTDKLTPVLNSAVRVATNTREYDRRFQHAMTHDLHCLYITDQIQFRIAVSMELLRTIPV